MDLEDIGYLQSVQTHGGWGKTKLANIGVVQSNNCDLCGASFHDVDHSIWTCKALQKDRIEADPELAAIDPDLLHPAIRRGIAPAMGIKPEATYWGDAIKDGVDDETRKLLGARLAPMECCEARNIHNANASLCNARQLVSVTRGGFGQGASPSFPENV